VGKFFFYIMLFRLLVRFGSTPGELRD